MVNSTGNLSTAEPAVSVRAGRLLCTVEHKTYVVQAAERLLGTGDTGALLRRIGLFS